MSIVTLADLQTHLQWAIEIEHSTIPPYLYAFFSLEPTSPAAPVILDVVLEEMYHLALGCNMLNAIGGQPAINNPTFVPTYPGPLPHHAPDPPLTVRLQPASIDGIADVFLAIEKPETIGDLPEDDNYTSLGQLYAAIAQGFTNLNSSLGSAGLFIGNPSLQVIGPPLDEGGAKGDPELMPVHDLPSALAAINQIVEQGEGTQQSESPFDGELAHYWRFNQIVDGTVALGPVIPAVSDPSTASLPTETLAELSLVFDGCYVLLLRALHETFNGGYATFGQPAITLMGGVVAPIARLLMRQPIGATGTFAGPAFEFKNIAQSVLVADCQALASSFPGAGGAASPLTNVANILANMIPVPGDPLPTPSPPPPPPSHTPHLPQGGGGPPNTHQ